MIPVRNQNELRLQYKMDTGRYPQRHDQEVEFRCCECDSNNYENVDIELSDVEYINWIENKLIKLLKDESKNK